MEATHPPRPESNLLSPSRWWLAFGAGLWLVAIPCVQAANPSITLPGASPSTIEDTATSNPFNGAEVKDSDGGNVTVSITFTSVRGTLSGSGISGGSGNYTISSRSLADAQSALRGAVFDPADNRILMTSPSEVTTFTVTVTDPDSHSDSATSSVTVTPHNDAPSLSFSGSNSLIQDNATSTPFSTASVSDVDAGETLTATITYPSEDGTLAKGPSSPALTLSGSAGSYAVSSGSVSDLQSLLRKLVFDPTENRLPVSPPGDTKDTTTFSVAITDRGGLPANATRSQEVESHNDAPLISGSPTSPVNDNWNATVFSPLTVRDPDFVKEGSTLVPQPVSLVVDLGEGDSAALGNFPGYTDAITLSGQAISGSGSVEDQLHALVFQPTSNLNPVGSTDPVTVSMTATDSLGSVGTASPTFDVLSVNDAPTLTVVLTATSVADNRTIQPFDVTITDPDVEETFEVTLNPASGAHYTFEPAPSPAYTGSASEIEDVLSGVRFRPTADLNSNETVSFTMSVTDVHGPPGSSSKGSPVTSGTLSLTILGINDPPAIAVPAGTIYRVTDDPAVAPILPFGSVSITDRDSASLTVTLRVEGRTPGVFTLPGSPSTQGAVLSFQGSPTDVSRLIKTVTFAAGQRTGRVLGEQDTVRLAIAVEDGSSLRSDRTTTVVVTAVNAAPQITGVPASSAEAPYRLDPATPGNPVHPFAGVAITDDEDADLTLVVRLDDADKGILTTLGGFSERADEPGVYEFTGDATSATADLQALVFEVNEDYLFAPSSPGLTTFTIEATDAVLNTAEEGLTIVLSEEARNWLVTTSEDNTEEGSLRWVLDQVAAGSASSAVVTFALPGYPATIQLTNGPFVLNRNVTFKGPGADLLIISGDPQGDGVPDFQLFRVESAVTMECLTLAEGAATDGLSVTGGAVAVGPSGRLTLRHCVVRDSVAAQWGGGIDVDQGSLTMEGCLVRGNITESGLGLGGGGVSLFTDLPCSFVNTTFSGNAQSAVTGIGGGALYVENYTPSTELEVLVSQCTFAGNTEAGGQGGTSIHANVFGTQVTVRNSVFADGATRNLEVQGTASITSAGGNVSDDQTRTVLTQDGQPKDVVLLNLSSDRRSEADILLDFDASIRPVPGYRLSRFSAAVGRAVSPSEPVDQRGAWRDNDPDAGALERGIGERIVLNEIDYDPAASGPQFLEFYAPRDSAVVNLSGMMVRVDGTNRFTFPAGTSVRPGAGILVADTTLTADGYPTPTPVLALPVGESLELGRSGVVELLRPNGDVRLRVEYVASFVDPYDPQNDTKFDHTSITLAPQLRGCAYLPHGIVDSSPLGGGKDLTDPLLDPQADPNSPGGAITTPFGSPNAYPVAVGDAFIVGEDVVTALDVLPNDIEDDGADQLIIQDVSATAGAGGTEAQILTSRGAMVRVDPIATPLRGARVLYSPLTSTASGTGLQALPVGAEATDQFTYTVIDVGGGEIEDYTGTPGSSPVTVKVSNHRLTNGDQITIQGAGTPSYNNTFTVTLVDADHFTVPTLFMDGTDTLGTWATVLPRTPTAASEATVSLTVLGANDFPVAAADEIAATDANEDTPLRIMAGPIPSPAAVAASFDTDGDYPTKPVILTHLSLLGGGATPDSDPDVDDSGATLRVIGVVGSVNPITAYASAADGAAVEVDSPNHGLTDDTVILISGYEGYSGYNGFHGVTVVDDNHFTIDVPYVDHADGTGVWAILNDANRLQCISELGAEVRLEIRVDRLETSVVYNPLPSDTLNALAAGEEAPDHFYYAVTDRHSAVSLGLVTVHVAGRNDAPVPAADPGSLSLLDSWMAGGSSLADVLSSLAIAYTLPPASGLPGRIDAELQNDDVPPQRVLLLDLFTTDEETPLAINSADLLANDHDVDSSDTLRVKSVGSPSREQAAVSLSADGFTVTYNPVGSARLQSLARGEPLIDTFEIVVSDDNLGDVTSLVAVLVVGVNDTPVAVDDAVATNEETPVSLNPILFPPEDPSFHDSDVDRDGSAPDNRLMVIPGSWETSVGALVTTGPDSLTYDPTTSAFLNELAVGQSYVDAVDYTVMDGSFLFANDDHYQVEADGTGFALNLLANDRNLTGIGTLVAGYDGVVGAAPVTVSAPGHGLTSGMTVGIAGYGGQGLYNQTFPIDVLDADTFTIPAIYRDDDPVKGNWSRLRITALSTTSQGGSVEISADGSTVAYTPEVNFVGDEVFAYTLMDELGNTDEGLAVVKVVVNQLNGNLQANPDRFTVARGQSPVLDVLANDNILPALGQSLILSSEVSSPLLVTDESPVLDTLIVVDNRIQFVQGENTPADGFPYEVHFTYQVSGGGVSTATAEVIVRVVDRNDTLPVRDDAFAVLAGSHDNPLWVLDNDTILPGSGEVLAVAEIVTAPAHGEAVISSDGLSVNYTPESGFVGEDTFAYRASDNLGGTGLAGVRVSVGGLTTSPDFFAAPYDDSTRTDDNGSVEIDVLANDSVLGSAPVDLHLATFAPVTLSLGTMSVSGDDRRLVFDPAEDQEGELEFVYTVEDQSTPPRTAEGRLVLVVARSSVRAGSDFFVVSADSSANPLAVLANDVAIPDRGRTLTVLSIGTGVQAPNRGGIVILNDNHDGLIYTPAPGFVGEETFTYTMTDSRGTDTAAVVVTVGTGALSANDDQFTVFYDSANAREFDLRVLANDLVLPSAGQVLTITGVGIDDANGQNAPTEQGEVSIAADGTHLRYVARNDAGPFPYTERFTYEISDGTERRSQAVVHVVVEERTGARALETNADAFAVEAGSSGNMLEVLANDGVKPAGTLNWTLEAIDPAPNHGGHVVISGSVVLYSPAPDFVGTEKFTYAVSDGIGGTASALVTVKVGDLPLAEDRFVALSDSGNNVFDVLANDAIRPAEGTGFHLNSVSPWVAVTDRVLEVRDNLVFYAPSASYSGPWPYLDGFDYVVVDDSGGTVTGHALVEVHEIDTDRAVGTVEVTVNGVNDAPTIDLGGLGTLTVKDDSHVQPFVGIVIDDVDSALVNGAWTGHQEPLEVRLVIDDPGAGRLTDLGGFEEQPYGSGVYVFHGTGEEATAALQGIWFEPTPNWFTYPQIQPVTFDILVTDPYVSVPTGAVVTVNVETVNDAPVILGTVADQHVYHLSTIRPFASTTIVELDDRTLQPLVVTLSYDATHGDLVETGGFVWEADGLFVFHGTGAEATVALREIVFAPDTGDRLSVDLVPPADCEETVFTLAVDDSYWTPVVQDSTTSVFACNSLVTKLLAGDGSKPDQFGYAVGAARDLVVVGAPMRDDSAGREAGAVYVHERNQDGLDTWGVVAELFSSAPQAGARFGHSVSVSGRVIAVGAPFTKPGSKDCGAVYVFERSSATSLDWQLNVVQLMPPAPERLQQFGFSVSIHGDFLAVGSPYQDDAGSDAGAVYLYQRQGFKNWTLIGPALHSSDLASGDLFGHAVSMSVDRLAVGAPQQDSAVKDGGAVYLFERSPAGTWSQTRKFMARLPNGSLDADAGDLFGFSVGLDGDTLLVGSPHDDDVGNDRGSAYVLGRDTGGAGNWGAMIKLAPTETLNNDEFGYAVSLSRDTALVGMPFDGESNQSRWGSAWVYGRDRGGEDAWGLFEKLDPPDNRNNDEFGYSVAIASGTVVVGARLDDSVGLNAGSAYIYEVRINNAPAPGTPSLPDQIAVVDEVFSYVVPATAFGDPDVDETITWSATGGPAWLNFDADTRTFSGTPSLADLGTTVIRVTATDYDGASASAEFNLEVTDTPPPVVPDPAEATSYDEWLARLLPERILNDALLMTTVYAPDGNVDNDPFTNFEEYAYGTHLLEVNLDDGPQLRIGLTADGRVVVSFVRRTNDPSLSFGLEYSTELDVWRDAADLEHEEYVDRLTSSTERLHVVLPADFNAANAFFRVRIDADN
ncbi:MAG: tandem-95 repeat protein [Verrucomicrobiales bacterium]|nr:tandem-95 repeat protein [Verrucomicrobiales bacterium]